MNSNVHVGEVLGHRDGLIVINCRLCGWAHLRELPDAAALSGYYKSDFWQKEKAGALEIMEAEHDWLDDRHGDWLSALERYTRGRTMLDVGCGYGFFLGQAKLRGWMVSGIELSAEAAQYAQQQNISVGTYVGGPAVYVGNWADGDDRLLYILPPADLHFDVISALWLMEHLPDPMAFLRWCRAHLYDAGALLLIVPNDFSAAQWAANEQVRKPFWWIHHTHLNYFTWATLSNLLGRAGFRIVNQLTAYPMESFLPGSYQSYQESVPMYDYTADHEAGQEAHAIVKQFDLKRTREERLAHYRKLALRGEGRELIVVAKPA